MKDLKKIKLFLLDMDGTIYLDNDLFEGVTDFLDYIKSTGGRYIFLTNNSSKSVDKYIEKLASLGISSVADDFLTSTDATILYLKKKNYKKIILKAVVVRKLRYIFLLRICLKRFLTINNASAVSNT